MATTIEAFFDGDVLRPTQPLTLEPNTIVRITIETITVAVENELPDTNEPKPTSKRKSFLETARSLNLDGPPDWSKNIDNHLYSQITPAEDVLPTDNMSEKVQPKETDLKKPVSFLDVALSLKLEGPPDWATNIDKYLYGGLVPEEE